MQANTVGFDERTEVLTPLQNFNRLKIDLSNQLHVLRTNAIVLPF